jgi:hypothetical protein
VSAPPYIPAAARARSDAQPLTVLRALLDPRVRPPLGQRRGTHEIVVDDDGFYKTTYRVWRDAFGELNINEMRRDRAMIDRRVGIRSGVTTVLYIDELDAVCAIRPYADTVP